MRTPSVSVEVDVDLDEFDDDDIIKYMKSKGYVIIEKDSTECEALKTKEFSYQTEKILERLEELMSRHNPWKVLAYLEEAKL